MYYIGTQEYTKRGIDTVTSLEMILDRVRSRDSDPQIVGFISSDPRIEEISSRVAHAFKGDTITLGTYSIMFYGGRLYPDNVFLAIIDRNDDVIASAGLIDNVSSCPVRRIGEIEKSIMHVSPGENDTVCVEFTTSGEEMVVTTLNSAFGGSSVPLIGGTVNASHEGMITAVSYDGKIYNDACIYLMIRNLKGRILAYTENIYQKHDQTAHYATKVELDKKALNEIDGRPAADVVAEVLGIPKDHVADEAIRHPLGRIIGNTNHIVAYHSMGDDGTLYNHKQVNLNDMLYIMDLRDYRKVLKETVSRIIEDTGNIGFVFSMDCINRYFLYTREGFFDEYAQTLKRKFGNHFGVVSAGEQFCTQHINQAMVCAVFENILPQEI